MGINFDLKGKVAVVTGASKGIGAAVATALGRAGANVVVNFNSDEPGARRVVERIEAGGGHAVCIKADVSDSSQVFSLFKASSERFGTIDILVNNAGIFSFNELTAVSTDTFHQHFNINVLGTLLATQCVLKYFSDSGGSIINIGSGASNHPGANNGLYAMTKGAIDVMTKALALELGPKNIRVNAIAPGATETEGAHSLGVFNNDVDKTIIAITPLARIGQPEDVASVVVFLASDASRWITGDRINVSGGLHLKH